MANSTRKAESEVPSEAEPAQITADELEYHKKLIEQVRWANEARPRIERIESAWKMWAEHLHEKYGLGVGDGVVETGEIVRSAQPQPQLELDAQ